jgi:hypothetical protein
METPFKQKEADAPGGFLLTNADLVMKVAEGLLFTTRSSQASRLKRLGAIRS